ncbi:hypothetical protein C1H46_019512 [Malus baccata]|uniref:Uncharacterized protein n=1 Tax=Malus baccata TaxID=106549 RepID=A0A540M7Z3_MALBA|nr:hypothetical protein C1H46_019512 [Malus baccata]
MADFSGLSLPEPDTATSTMEPFSINHTPLNAVEECLMPIPTLQTLVVPIRDMLKKISSELENFQHNHASSARDVKKSLQRLVSTREHDNTGILVVRKRYLGALEDDVPPNVLTPV